MARCATKSSSSAESSKPSRSRRTLTGALRSLPQGCSFLNRTRKSDNAVAVVEDINSRRTKLSQAAGSERSRSRSATTSVPSGVAVLRALFAADLARDCRNQILDLSQAKAVRPAAEPLLLRAYACEVRALPETEPCLCHKRIDRHRGCECRSPKEREPQRDGRFCR